MIADLLMSPNEQARRLIGRDYLSWSSLSAWQQCPLKFYFRYVAQVPEESLSPSLAMGSAIHAAIQRHYERRLACGTPPDLDGLMDAYDEEWTTKPQELLRYARGETQESIRDCARRMLAAFQADPISQLDGSSVLAVEEEVRKPIMDDFPDLLIRVDLVAETDSEVLIVDFKTSRSRWSAHQIDDRAGQLLLYGKLLEDVFAPFPDGASESALTSPARNASSAETARFPSASVPAPSLPLSENGDLAETPALAGRTKPHKLLFVVITKTKQPEIQLLEVQTSPRRLARQLHVLRQVWRSIRRGQVYPVPGVMNCSSCPYKRACQAWPADDALVDLQRSGR